VEENPWKSEEMAGKMREKLGEQLLLLLLLLAAFYDFHLPALRSVRQLLLSASNFTAYCLRSEEMLQWGSKIPESWGRKAAILFIFMPNHF